MAKRRRAAAVCSPLPTSPVHRLLDAVFGPPAARPRADVIERLETRQLLSASAVASVVATGSGTVVDGPGSSSYGVTLPAAVTVTWQGQQARVFPGQYMVQTAHADQFTALAKRYGFTDVKYLGGGGAYSFNSTLTVDAMQKLAARKTTAFAAIEPNYKKTLASTVPDDQYFTTQYHLNNTGQLESYDYNLDGKITPYNAQKFPDGLPAGQTTNFPSPPYPNENQYGIAGDDDHTEQAWDITTGSSSVVVAVLDSGLDLNHPDIVPNLWTNPLDTAANGYNGDGFPNDVHGWNFVANTNDPTDDVGHGTNVAGILGAAGNNGIGVTGVDWHVSLLPVKIGDAAGSVSSTAEVAGLYYCIGLKARGINIVAMNESIGGSGVPFDLVEANAIARAGAAGILDVVAAGNESNNLDRVISTPGKFSAASASVITVAAVDNQGKLANFSDYGTTTVDLGAPGEHIFGTSPTYDVQETTTDATAGDDLPFGHNYAYESGTSQATPQVAGVLALEAAANPMATPAQLKAALLKGVTYDPNLAAANGNPALVATSGVLNAYQAVLNVQEPFVSANATHGGNWQNFVGTQGAYVVGESTSFPSIASITLGGGSPVVLDNTTNNPAAPQRISDPTERISAYQAAAGTQTINLTFTDGQYHQTSVYVADLDRKRRTENVSIIDTATGTVVDTEQAGNFTKGEYLTWNLRGSVTIQIDDVAGPSSVFSGLFFDAPNTLPITAQGTDTTTTGANWRSRFGSQGDYVIGDVGNTLPSYVSGFVASGNTTTILKPTTASPLGLQKNQDLTHTTQAYWGTSGFEDVGMTLTDGLAHNVTLYLADYGNRRRTERVQVIDPATGAVLVTQDYTNFAKGAYATFRVTGGVDFRITNTGGGPDAVVSGIFFDGVFATGAFFEGTDAGTQGNWQQAQYGTSYDYVAGSSFPGFDDTGNPGIATDGGALQVVANTTTDRRALSKVVPGHTTVPSNRVEAYIYTTSTMSMTVNTGDLVLHQMALYFADYENYKRVENVSIYNATTGALLTHQVLSNFRTGKYLIYDFSGPVRIQVDNAAYPNAVLSGVFIS